MKKFNRHGFTLAELLIVVAIIAVLVAVAIPVFNTQLEKARETTDVANLRSAYAEATANFLDTGTGTGTNSQAYKVQQRTAGWQKTDITASLPTELSSAAGALKDMTSGSFRVSVTQSTTTSAGVAVSLASAG